MMNNKTEINPKNKKTISLDMRYKEIKVLKFLQFDTEADLSTLKTPIVEFQTNFQFRVLDNEELIACLTIVKLVLMETKEDFAELKIENFFEIKPFNDVIKKKEDGFEIPNGIIVNIASISASTLRGILHEKLKGTIAEKEVYPLINVNDLFTQVSDKQKNN